LPKTECRYEEAEKYVGADQAVFQEILNFMACISGIEVTLYYHARTMTCSQGSGRVICGSRIW